MNEKINIKISEEEITQQLEHDMTVATSFFSAFKERCRKDYKLYRANRLGNEIKNQSQIVASDTYDTIEWILPDLLEIFNGDIFSVTCEQYPEVAIKIQKKINQMFNERPNGFIPKYTYFKDALIYKHAVAKSYVERKVKTTIERLPDMLLSDFNRLREDATIGHVFPDYKVVTLPQNPLMGVDTLHYNVTNIRIQRKYDEEPVIRTEILSPDEYRFSHQKDEYGVPLFQAHAKVVTWDYLKKKRDQYRYGKNVDDIIPSVSLEMQEFINSSLYEDDLPGSFDDTLKNDLLRPVEIWECHTKIDVNGDGLTEDIIALYVPNNNILLDLQLNDVGNMFHRITNCIDTHKFLGISISEQLEDLQKLNTALQRNLVDNLSRINYGYWRLDPNNLTALSDILAHAGFIRAPKDGVERLSPTPLGMDIYHALEFFRSKEENKLGVTRYSQGTQGESLNRTAEGIRRIMRASSKRIRLIARIYSETGLSDLASFYAHIASRYIFQIPENVKVTAKCSVGAAEADQEDSIKQLDYLLNLVVGLAQKGIYVTSPQKIYNIVREVAIAMNRNPEDFVENPKDNPQAQGNPQQAGPPLPQGQPVGAMQPQGQPMGAPQTGMQPMGQPGASQPELTPEILAELMRGVGGNPNVRA